MAGYFFFPVIIGAVGIENDDWTEDSLTYGNRPGQGVSIATVSVELGPAWYDWDVTSFVNSQLAGDKVMSIYLDDLLTTDVPISWRSKEGAIYHPQIVLVPNPEQEAFLLDLEDDDSTSAETIMVEDLSGTAPDNDLSTTVFLCPDCADVIPGQEKTGIKLFPNPAAQTVTISASDSEINTDKFSSLSCEITSINRWANTGATPSNGSSSNNSFDPTTRALAKATSFC